MSSQTLDKNSVITAKAQIKQSISIWAISCGYDQQQIGLLVHHVCSNAIQYAFSIGTDTEVSAMDVLVDDLQDLPEGIYLDRALDIFVLVAFAVRYAQIDALQDG